MSVSHQLRAVSRAVVVDAVFVPLLCSPRPLGLTSLAQSPHCGRIPRAVQCAPPSMLLATANNVCRTKVSVVMC